MSESEVTRSGIRGARPDREAPTGARSTVGRRGKRGGEQPMVPSATFTSYYGQPVIKAPRWEARDIAGYLFLGGLAGASSLLAAGAHATGRGTLATLAKSGATAAGGLSLVALVHDLGKPLRFLNMLRVAKWTSPMSVGSWLLAGYVPVAGVATASAVTGRLPRIGAAATAASAALGPAVTSYTAALVSDTAVPAWHEGYREMPFVFVGSGATAAGGLGLFGPPGQAAPARALAALGTGCELAAFERMQHRMGMVAEPYTSGTPGTLVRAAKALSVAGVAGSYLARRSRVGSAVAGAALLAASACTRFGIFHAGVASANDPKYTVTPQRQRLVDAQRRGTSRRG